MPGGVDCTRSKGLVGAQSCATGTVRSRTNGPCQSSRAFHLRSGSGVDLPKIRRVLEPQVCTRVFAGRSRTSEVRVCQFRFGCRERTSHLVSCGAKGKDRFRMQSNICVWGVMAQRIGVEPI